MRIIPPELTYISRQQYLDDLQLRELCDLELQAERCDRIKLMLTPDLVADH